MAKPPPPDKDEPEKLAEAIATLGLRYAVITSVTRDDLEDGGAAHIAACVRSVKKKMPNLIVEVLVPDFKADRKAILAVIDAKPDVVSHNIETVERLTPKVRDLRAAYRQSLETLRLFRELSKGKLITKSGIMVGLGEDKGEVGKAMEDLRAVGADILTIGQYLQPSKRHVPVERYVTPEEFREYEAMGSKAGFRHVASAPLVRSSYMAAEPFIRGIFAIR
jgi:lipoic acid synthetase